VKSAIKTYGDTIHMFVERKNYKGIFMPGFVKWESEYNPSSTGLKYIDHMVGNVELGAMNHWAEFYGKVLGFANLVTFDDKDISTQYTALMSKVMTNGNGRIKFPINEPAMGLKKSQIEEYLDFYKGPGCQHIAVFFIWAFPSEGARVRLSAAIFLLVTSQKGFTLQSLTQAPEIKKLYSHFHVDILIHGASISRAVLVTYITCGFLKNIPPFIAQALAERCL
jgi:hypothetical protein